MFVALCFPVWTANCDLSSLSILIISWVGIYIVGFKMTTQNLIFMDDCAYIDYVYRPMPISILWGLLSS